MVKVVNDVFISEKAFEHFKSDLYSPNSFKESNLYKPTTKESDETQVFIMLS